MNMKETFNGVIRSLKKHAPELCIGFGIAAMFGAVVEGIRETPKALERIEEMKNDLGKEELTKKETVKAVWKSYIPSAAMFAAGTALILGARKQYAGRIAALSAACTLKDEELDLIKKKAKELLGDKKEEEIEAETNKELYTRRNVSYDSIPSPELVRCYDVASGKPFLSNKTRIDTAINNLNYRLRDEMTLTLNDYFCEIGVDECEYGRALGWDVNDMNNRGIYPIYSSMLDTDDNPVLCVSLSKPAYFLYD